MLRFIVIVSLLSLLFGRGGRHHHVHRHHGGMGMFFLFPFLLGGLGHGPRPHGFHRGPGMGGPGGFHHGGGFRTPMGHHSGFHGRF